MNAPPSVTGPSTSSKKSRASLAFGLEMMDELADFLAQVFRCVGYPHPAASPDIILEPVLEHVRDAHQIHIDPATLSAPDVVVPADGLPRHHAAQPCLLLCFPNRRVARSFAIVDRAFRHNPPFAPCCCDEGDLNVVVADPIRNYGRLRMYTRHPYSLSWAGLCSTPAFEKRN